MGYYTDYSLSISYGSVVNGVFKETSMKDVPKERIEALKREIEKMQVFEYVTVEPGYNYGDAWVNTKWYEHDEDMLALSCRFPDFFFTLNGAGEEQGDLWNTYYYNGKMQECRAEIIWPDFDYKKLVSSDYSADNRFRSPNYRYSYE